jgi:hypothetical protein
MIVKVFRGISKDFAELTKTAQMEKTTDYTGCGFRTIQRYLAEEKKCAQLMAPKKPDRKCMIKLEEHQKYLIRKTMHSFFWNLESLPKCINIKPFPFLWQDTWLL